MKMDEGWCFSWDQSHQSSLLVAMAKLGLRHWMQIYYVTTTFIDLLVSRCREKFFQSKKKWLSDAKRKQKFDFPAAERAQAGAMGHCEIGSTRAGRQERNSGVPSCSSLDCYQILLKHGLCLMSTMQLIVHYPLSRGCCLM